MPAQSSIIPQNHVKQKLTSGATAIGTFVVEFRQPAVMQMLANAGCDFATIDNEHGAFSIEAIAELSRSAIFMGITPLVRIPEISYAHIAQTMDVGAQGLMVPRITSAAEVRSIVQMLHYPPHGVRGNAMERGLTQFKSGNVADTLVELESQALLIIQIETLQAIENLDDILAVDGLDAALVGPNDLSIALGYPGQAGHPVVQEAIRQVIQSCRAHGVIPGIHMGQTEQAAAWARQGMQLISTGSEAAFIQRGAAAAVNAIRSSQDAQ